MDIYLIRHGESHKYSPTNYDEEKNAANPRLTEIGYLQAHMLAERLAHIKFDKIYCSDLIRASETAKVLNSKINSKVIEEPNFREIDMGDIQLHPWENYPEQYAEWSKFEEDIPYPGGENGAMLWKRCQKSLERIVERDYEHVAIVAHGGVIRSIVCGILNIPQVKRFSLGFPTENCSVSIIKFLKEERKYYLHTFNVTG